MQTTPPLFELAFLTFAGRRARFPRGACSPLLRTWVRPRSGRGFLARNTATSGPCRRPSGVSPRERNALPVLAREDRLGTNLLSTCRSHSRFPRTTCRYRHKRNRRNAGRTGKFPCSRRGTLRRRPRCRPETLHPRPGWRGPRKGLRRRKHTVSRRSRFPTRPSIPRRTSRCRRRDAGWFCLFRRGFAAGRQPRPPGRSG